MQTPKETNHETDTNRYTFSLVSDPAFSCRVKIRYQQLLIFLSFITNVL